MTKTLFVAGATGAIGSRLLPLLVARGYKVYGLTRRESRIDALRGLGAIPVVGDVFDAPRLSDALLAARPDIVIHQLTDLPPGLDPALMEAAAGRNARIRAEGTANLMRAAVDSGAGLMVAQSIAWAYADGPLPHAESAPLDIHAEGRRGVTVRGVRALEDTVLHTPGITGIVLRFGQLYGPGTGSDTAQGLSMPLHVDGAARATLLAMEDGRAGVYNIAEANGQVSTDKARRELRWIDAPRRSRDAPIE
ncbi:dTDP-glucose 4,6-dehydratase [Bordetella sp. H567]|uniref:NAD-dependent epimerase/dehydratase family protein n=1 Tax=Bordetella sp. H567 TaxID=1697043 RepID=UPI00081CCB88|nr:NAD(P)-dependent oxidoreductase [Bordetella sp. H567]AOB29941.1 dTDP-glucose 4,6-dehydratase [Bordetella sp. H567]